MLVTGNLVTPMKNYMELRNSLIQNYIAQYVYLQHIMLVTGNLVTPMKNYMELRNSLIPNYNAQYIFNHYAGNW